jgi:hypothetical protein
LVCIIIDYWGDVSETLPVNPPIEVRRALFAIP